MTAIRSTGSFSFFPVKLAGQISNPTPATGEAAPTRSAGVEYNPRADKVSPLANWLAVKLRRSLRHA